MKKKDWDSEWIHFSRRARRGVVFLLFVFVLVAVSPRIYYNYFYTPTDYDVEISSIFPTDSLNTTKQFESVEESRYKVPENEFDPNLYTEEEWMNVGLSQKQAASILKYLGSGAVLKTKKDLKKLYVVDDELYELLAPKLTLPDSLLKQDHFNNKEERKYSNYENNKAYSDKESFDSLENKLSDEDLEPVSINTASAWDLKKIPGIGPFTAKEIIKIRESYGGIISYDQLFDIYRMDEERLESIKPFLIIDKSEINKLNVNTATVEELRNHPLIDHSTAKSIVLFRENNRPYKSIDELLLTPYIDREKYLTILPYVKVE